MTCVTRMILELGRFLRSVKKDSSRKVPTKFDHGNSERRHLGSLLTPRPRRRSYFIGKLNYYYNSFAWFQLQRHVILGDIHPNPGPTLEQNSRQETKPTRKPKLSCWSLSVANKGRVGRELISRLRNAGSQNGFEIESSPLTLFFVV